MKKLALLFFITLFISCVSETEHQKILKENEILKAELQELKFGIPNLLRDTKKLFELGDFRGAKEKVEVLINNHPNTIETLEAEKLLPAIIEEWLWGEIENSDNLDLINEYREKYPKGKYSEKAHNKKKEVVVKIDSEAFESAKSKNTLSAYNKYLDEFPKGSHRSNVKKNIVTLKKAIQKEAYETAKGKNTSYAWEQFLDDYPNHSDKSSIERKIISLKVDEIMGDGNTGELPTFSQTNKGYTSTSSVTIKNDTGYELIVRYSGPSVKKIVIPKGSTRTTNLSSGSYKIAASANNLHYAGREVLSGSYTSNYYITRTRY